jgi:predicted transcriptional regulator
MGDIRVDLIHKVVRPRSRIDIMATILDEVRLSAEGLRKTRLMYRCNLSFKQLKVYLKLLEDKKFLSVMLANNGIGNVKIYRITEEGRSFLTAYNELRNRLKEGRLTR